MRATTKRTDHGKLSAAITFVKNHKRQSAIAGTALLFGTIGVILLTSSSAATNAVAIEAEAGTRSGNTSAGAAGGASGGASVKFGTPGTNPNPTPTPPTPGTPPVINGVPAITRDGIKLMRAGKQWKFAGMNADAWGLNACRDGGDYEESGNMTDANIDQYFRELNPHSVTRIWPYRGSGNIALMDKIVAAAEKYNQYLAPAFFDGNGGGTQCGSKKWGDVNANLAHIRPIVERYAKETGTRKTNVIAFWEMSNEISSESSFSWHDAMAKGIKQMDPKTLVGTGSAQYNDDPPNPSKDLQEIIDLHKSAAIDLISIHEYDNGCKVSHQATKAIAAAKQLNKPWYSGESGGRYENGGDYTGGPNMGDCLKREWQAYIDQNESAGMLYWDFKMQRMGAKASGSDTATFIGGANDLWNAAKSFRHQYQGL